MRTFALGYAPDCYYGDEKKEKRKGRSPSGSLVEYLAEAGFTPQEIVEAGLAVWRRKKQQPWSQRKTYKSQKNDEGNVPSELGKESNSKEGEEKLQKDKEEQHDYSDLMDRFRSRLIIPILDAGGQHVIALGGRHLASEEEAGKFKPAKYINSPDSIVFTKKNVLFNQHLAKLAMEADNTATSKKHPSSSEDRSANTNDHPPPAIIIVEGYFDVIALYNVGVRNVVASMGTALPAEQLTIAAEMGSVPGGEWRFS